MLTFVNGRNGMRQILVAGIVLALAAAGTGRARAEDPVSRALTRHLGGFAAEIKTFLDARGEAEVSIGQFVGPPQLAANPGPGLALLLRRELQKRKVAVRSRANVGINGEFREVVGDAANPLSVELKVKIVDRTNKALRVLSCGLFGAGEMAFLTAANTRLPKNGDAKARARKLKEDLDRPPVVVRGSQVSVGDDRPYTVEILVKGRPRQAALEDGLPFVSIDRGEVYAIRLTNNTDSEAAVELTIDGVNIFAFNEDPDADGQVRGDYRVILKKRGAQVVYGWYRAKNMSDSFKVTEYAKSAAFLKESTASVGTISASFCPCWERPKEIIVGSPLGSTLGSSASGTGFGKRVEERYRTIVRDFGDVAAVITLRYTKD